MIEQHTHQGRWTQVMPACSTREGPGPTKPGSLTDGLYPRRAEGTGRATAGETLRDKLRRWLRFGNPERTEGRSRIDPELPYGHWANGWGSPTYPEKKKIR